MNATTANQLLRWTMVAGLVFTSSGCTNTPMADDSTGNQDPPTIPPRSTFVIDFGEFANAESTDQSNSSENGKGTQNAQSIPGSNWFFAAGSVLVWNTILTVTLAVPVAAFGESFNHDPEFQGNGTWTWTYDVDVIGVTYTAVLTGTLTEDGVDWGMVISQENGFQNVEWFVGQSTFDGTEGRWTLNRDPDNLTPFIQIEWTREQTPGFSDIRITNIAEGTEDSGSFVYATNTDGAERNITYTIFNVREARTTVIEWNQVNRDGRAQDETRFESEEFQCWDSELQNVECTDDTSTGDDGTTATEADAVTEME
ncbi:MAG: hypothetical protein ACPGXK_13430 [Phycisphaerae bacterium]